MSNLALGVTLGMDRTTRARYVHRTFPGALPWVLYQGGDPVSYHLKREEAAGELTRSDLRIDSGLHDWPESEVRNRVVLVGEVNPYQDRRDFDLYDMPEKASGHRLREKILGVSREDYFRRFYRRNLCVKTWSPVTAYERAASLRSEFSNYTFVLLGKKVQKAFGFGDVPDQVSRVDRSDARHGRSFVLIPHPSGLCRFWNEPGSIPTVRYALKNAGVFCGPVEGVVVGEKG